MMHLDANTVSLDDARVAPVCDVDVMPDRRPRVVLSITPRLLQDTLSVALSQHAEIIDLAEWRERPAAAGHAPSTFDVALVSGGVLPPTVAADVVIDVDSGDDIPSLDSLHECLRALAASE